MSELDQCMKALEIIGNGIIRKSDTGHKSAKVVKAMAIARATRTPEGAILARRVLQLQRQQVIRKQFGYSEPAPEEDEWSSMFSKADSEEDLLERLNALAEEKADIIRQLRQKRGLED